jgi:hypothetical protein
MSLRDMALAQVAGLPLFAYFGAATFIMLIATALLGHAALKGLCTVRKHRASALATIALGAAHGIMALSVLL